MTITKDEPEECNTENLKDCPFCGCRPRRYVDNNVLTIRCSGCGNGFSNHARFGCIADSEWNGGVE